MQIESNNDETLLVSKSQLAAFFTQWNNEGQVGKAAKDEPAKTAEDIGREQAEYTFNELAKVCAK